MFSLVLRVVVLLHGVASMAETPGATGRIVNVHVDVHDGQPQMEAGPADEEHLLKLQNRYQASKMNLLSAMALANQYVKHQMDSMQNHTGARHPVLFLG